MAVRQEWLAGPAPPLGAPPGPAPWGPPPGASGWSAKKARGARLDRGAPLEARLGGGPGGRGRRPRPPPLGDLAPLTRREASRGPPQQRQHLVEVVDRHACQP